MIDVELVNYATKLCCDLLTDDHMRPLPKENWLALIELLTAEMEDRYD